MAKKTKAAQADAAQELITAFVLRDFVDENVADDQDPVAYFEGQKLELAPDEFEAMASEKLVAKGVLAVMKTAIEGANISLRKGQKAWVSPKNYGAWKRAGLCEMNSEDPEVADIIARLNGVIDAQREELAEQNGAIKALIADLKGAYAELVEAGLREADIDVDAAAATDAAAT